MAELKADMPDGVDYEIVYDPTQFIRSSIEAVVVTLLEAIALVVLVVILFLQTWRASIIPLLAVPVSIIGTFAVMYAFGFSINALSLFALVLAIGIVVDDAIVVVENVERNIEAGLSPRDATHRAMREVSGPIIAIALVLVAVFVPLAFVSGLTGRFYNQFALTIAISTVISAINSLTLSPALSALLLKGRGEPDDALTRVMNRAFGWLFRGFNFVFGHGTRAYGGGVRRVLSRKALMMGLYLVLLGATFGVFRAVPDGFVPAQDKQYLVGFAQLPDGATLDRTEDVIRRMSDIAIAASRASRARWPFPASRSPGFTNSSNAGIVFVTLRPFEERESPELSGGALAMQLNQKFGAIEDAFIAMFPPPPVMGLGTIGGFKLQIEDRTGQGYQALDAATKAFMAEAAQAPELAGLFTSFQVNVPQLYADVDRTKARQLGVPVADVFETLQTYLGSAYVNDFNLFGRTYSVRVQADADFRARSDDVGQLEVRSTTGEMIPLSALLDVRPSAGPERATRYNGFLVRRHQRRSGARLLLRPGAGGGRAHRRRDAAAGVRLRVDGADLSGDPRRQLGAAGLSARHPPGLPGAGRALREPDAAARDHHDRADGALGGDGGGVADRRRQQHLHPDRPLRAGRAVGEERDPDRRVRPRPGGRRTAPRCRPPSRPAACACARS